ncbi:cilia- and flagella-associated protein 54 isoform X2 [Xenopus laevis]|uniref:Cilia- and flagella-associated protein 54 isoform X2 n=1 Tax=Xenopus laevis TaxID=8355 RepID=A0A8J0UPJ4_XENLA|nr:cilia- and flagella-associated protein 54 isoform X2 [Xenopus laevis]
MEPLPATFYGQIDRKNPVIATFENEISHLLGFIRKVRRAPCGSPGSMDYRKGSSTLFRIWVKYKPRLPTWYYQEKLLNVGDSLVQIKQYKLALFQCYGRYLEQFCSEGIDEITDVKQFKSTFFPDGTDDKNASLTFHALQGRCICLYQLVKMSDLNLQNPESLKKCVNILSFLQLIMQVVLPQEQLCWLTFNGSIHIYTICRHLMVLGYSSKALEYLLWASVCMESSVPLLSVHYLTWRATLYTAVCQCYYDCQAGVHGEVFARRALSKINELSQLENISNSSGSEEAKKVFTEATAKMAVMIFKRAVFESRRKPKGMLRPKQKSNLKDVEKLPWPRTSTERLLVEMFDNGAVQFLAIIEALSDSNRRVLQGGPPVPDEPEIHDVIAELFFAGSDIVAGGGNKGQRGSCGQTELLKWLEQASLLDLALEEKDAVSVEAVVKFAKLAFSYEQWDAFDTIVMQVYTFLQAQDNTKWKEEKMNLNILIAAEPLLSGKKQKRHLQSEERSMKILKKSISLAIVHLIDLHGDSTQDRAQDDHMTLAETVFVSVCSSLQGIQPDREIIVDVILFLWQKCKFALQRIQAADGPKFIHKCEVNSKWIYILCLIYEVMQLCSIIDTDSVIMAEAALKLAGIAEGIADCIIKYVKKPEKLTEKVNDESATQGPYAAKLIQLEKNPVTQLTFAYETAEKAIKGMSLARSRGCTPDELSVIDHYCVTLGVKRQHLKNMAVEQNSPSKSLANNGMVMDLQLELIMTQHRVSVKLLNLLQECNIIGKIKKNKLSKAIFLMQKAVLFNKGLGSISPSQLLEDSEKLIRKLEAEENAVYLSCVKQDRSFGSEKKSVPPPPLLISRTEDSMVFKPAPFKSDIKVSWYCLFGRCVTGPDLKVRLKDQHLYGTGEEIPAGSGNLLEVKGLEANEKYIFAVAAYSSEGVLIGDAVGESTKPILAFPALSVPMTWAYLAQSAYHVGNYNMAKKAVSVLWNYFVLQPVSPQTHMAVVFARDQDYVSQKRLCLDVISKSSPVMLQHFLTSIFLLTDINIKEGGLFCDCLCNNGVLKKWQICRIAECERMLVALDVSTWLNDASYALQAVVQCYGLIAPIIYHRIPSVPVVQILIKCLAVIQEIPSSTWQRKQAAVTEGVLHMIACIVYYVAKVLRTWEEYELAIAIIEDGKKILDISENTSIFYLSSQPKLNYLETEKAKDIVDKEKVQLMRKCQKKKPSIAEKVSEQLSALELHLQKLTKPSDGADLTGHEDPMLLHAVVACWPTVAAYKEVMKFKKRSRFLEFFVQLLQRVVYEEKFQRALDWANTVLEHLKRRNENVLGISRTEAAEDAIPSDSFKRYTAALVEYHKDKEHPALKKERKQIKPEKHKESFPTQMRKNTKLSDSHRNLGEDLEKQAFATLRKLLLPVACRYIKHKKLNTFCTEEMPWRSQLNLLLAYIHFNMFRSKLDKLCSNESGWAHNSTRVLDPDLFALHHAGIVVMTTETTVLDEQIGSPGHLHPSLKLDLTSGTKLSDSNDFSEPSTKKTETDTPRTQMTNDTEDSSHTVTEQAQPNMLSVILFDHLGKIYIHLKRAVVLSHRAQHWTLFQNTCRVLWNLTLELQLLIKQNEVTNGRFALNSVLNNEIWLPFYLAADSILDMLVILQSTGAVKVVDCDEAFSVPSCMGGPAYEEGGSNLTFEYPLDDVNVIDMRWMHDLVLKAIELLYRVQRWEALVHLAVQFNLLTHERYTEQVTPLLVHAQRMLIARIQEINSKYVVGPEEKINCREYIGRDVHVAVSSTKIKNPGSKVNWKGQTVLPDGREVKVLASVPLDVMDTLACFRETLQKSKYSSRALRHSRKLLALLLAHDQGLNARERVSSPYSAFGKVSFSAGALKAHQPVPPDLSEEEFHSVHSIESKALPPSYLSFVITSYDKTVEILHSDNQQGLKAQALHELGNLHMFAGNKRAAFKCWCRALDETLNMSDTLNSWQELNSSPDSISSGRSKDYSEKFLSRAGIWGCLQAAVITAKMSRYILTSNVRKRTECCILSALLFKALLLASMPHPTENRDYALYEIGEGCEISELIPGIDLFSDRYRADVAIVVGSLSFVISELHAASQNLIVLPLFTLYQYFVSMICRDPVRSVKGRLLKINVLTDLHLFTEAFHEICLLNHGKRIPSRTIQGFKQNAKQLTFPTFSSSMTMLSSENLQAIQEVLNRKPSSYLQSVCDQDTVNKFVLAKMHFIVKLSTTINAIPKAENKPSNSVAEDSVSSQELETDIPGNKSKDVEESVSLSLKQDLTPSELKGILLNEAEERLNMILQNLQEKYECQLSQCSAVDLKMAIEAKLQLSEIVQQRHETALSVALAYSTMLLLHKANIFITKPPKDGKHASSKGKQHTALNLKDDQASTIVEPELHSEAEAIHLLDIRLWLRCRLSLVNSLVAQLRGIALKEEDFLDSSAIITEGIMEAESLSDSETQAHFMLQGAYLHIQEGHSKKAVQIMLENIITLLDEKQFMSPAACLTFAQSLLLSADLIEMENGKDQQLFWEKQLNFLTLAQEMIIKQMISLGEAIEYRVTDPMTISPVQPLKNIYLPHINLLAKIKLRIGHILSIKASTSSGMPSLNMYTTALELCRVSSFREYDLEAELHFQKGKEEHKMFELGDLEKSSAIQSFSEAIHISQNYDQNFSLIRKSYMEIALLYLHLANMDANRSDPKDSPTVEAKIASAKGKVDKLMEEDINEKMLSLSELYSLLAWTAIRAATQVGNAMLAFKQLIGVSSVSAQSLNTTLLGQIPKFACMDLLASYKNFLSGEGQGMDKSAQKDGGFTDNLPKETLSWVHLIRYHNHLLRLISMINMSGSSTSLEENCPSADTLLSSVFQHGVTVRFAAMHQFLKKNLESYAICCVNDFPQEILIGTKKSLIDLCVLRKTISESEKLQPATSSLKIPATVFIDTKQDVLNEQMATNSLGEELCIQWYLPSLEQLGKRKFMVLLLYAYNKKGLTVKDPKKCDPSSLLCGHVWLPLSHVCSLQEKLHALRQKAESTLQPERAASVTDSGAKMKQLTQSAKSKTNLKTISVPEEIQKNVKQLCFEIQQLLCPVQDPKAFTETPFDITLPSLIRLERMFDPTHGCMLMKGCLLDWIVSQLT